MDYQKEYIAKNPKLALDEAELKSKQIQKFLGPIKVGSLLDVACGAGGITKIMDEQLESKRTVGLDISETMIKTAKRRDKGGKVTWICQDIFNYKTNHKFDLVLGIDIIEHIDNDLGILKKISTLGKKVLIKVPMEDSVLDNKIIRRLGIRDPWKESEEKYGHINHYNERGLLKLFHDAGFRIIKQGYIPLPKRSKVFWEILRVMFLPIGWFSTKAMANWVGGFKIVLIEPKF